MMERTLYYGDNLEVLRNRIRDDTIDLCYIDPPFNSKRNYNQIYNNIGEEDRAQAQAFVDTWIWDRQADAGLTEILANEPARFSPQTIALIGGLKAVLGKGSMLAYLVSMTLRITEIHRVLKPTGSFYLHCDPTASHYLKLVCDGIFCGGGRVGNFVNEISWSYKGNSVPKKCFPRKHDILFWYSKTNSYTFKPNDVLVPYSDLTEKRYNHTDQDGRRYKISALRNGKQDIVYMKEGKYPDDVWEIPIVRGNQALGYPTQKPEALLERIIKASSNEGDVVLDAYCGCGTTVAVAERLNRQWIGIDITYQSVSLILKRLEDAQGSYDKLRDDIKDIDTKKTNILDLITLDGIPRDMESAVALAHKKDDRPRKEFEKWAVLTYTNNRGIIFEKKGADGGIDGLVHFMTSHDENAKMVLQVKSGNVGRGDIAKLNSDRQREGAELATLLTLEPPTKPMINEARMAGYYQYPGGATFDRIQIVTIEEMLGGQRLNLPSVRDVLKSAERVGRQGPEQKWLF